jgi:hypothetical protein
MADHSVARAKIGSKAAAPEWAKLERQIITTLNEVAPEFVARYTRSDGSIIWRSSTQSGAAKKSMN